jgi:signal peptidase
LTQRISGWLEVAGSWLSAAVLALAVVLFLAVILIPHISGVELRTVVSGSMEPSLPRGSIAIGLPTDVDTLRIGDIVMFRRPDMPSEIVTHRIVAVADEGTLRRFATKGDANNSPDYWDVDGNLVLARLGFYVPLLGYAAEVFQSPVTLLALVFIPGVLVLLHEFPVWEEFVTYGCELEFYEGDSNEFPDSFDVFNIRSIRIEARSHKGGG